MRRSPLLLSTLELSDKEALLRDTENIPEVGYMHQVVKFVSGEMVKLNFIQLLHHKCSPNEAKVKNRKEHIRLLAKSFYTQIRDGVSTDKLVSTFTRGKNYIKFCDTANVDPFSRNGYRSYVGEHGELRRLVKKANTPKPYMFLYEDGEHVGVKESSALGMALAAKDFLKWACIYQEGWGLDASDFVAEDVPVAPYDERELDISLTRLQLFYYSITSSLVALKNSYPESAPPDSLIAVVDKDDQDSLVEVEIAIESRTKIKPNSLQLSAPFNRAMQAGYFLFSYYTSFNSSTIFDVKHPIDFLTEKKEGRTLKYASVRGYKGRANKEVSSTFTDQIDLDDTETYGNDEYVTAEVDKKDGIKFIKSLIELSKLYNPGNNQYLFYQLDQSQNVRPIGPYIGKNTLPYLLGLYSSQRKPVADYLIKLFYLAENENKRVEVDLSQGIVSNKIVDVKSVQTKKIYLDRVAYAAVRSLTDIDLKDIIVPIKHGDIDADGMVTLSLKYKNGCSAELVIDSEYQSFFESLECRALNYKTPKSDCYLFPLGHKGSLYQWRGLELTKSSFLRKLGIGKGDYFLSLTAMKFRSTTSNNYYDPNDSGYSVSKHILQNTINTLHKHYVNGHPAQNKIITSQAIHILENWSETGDIQESKANIKAKLNIPVLEYDEWKRLRIPTNPNGFLCTGEPTPEIEKQHKHSERFSRKLLDNNANISCYQFDKCIECSSSKLVDEINSAYKLLSFIDLIEESSERIPERSEEFMLKANQLREVAEENLSKAVLEAAEDKLMNEGRYFLHNDNFIYT
jgi:hypothetical protein